MKANVFKTCHWTKVSHTQSDFHLLTKEGKLNKIMEKVFAGFRNVRIYAGTANLSLKRSLKWL